MGDKEMKNNKWLLGFVLIFSFSLLLAACGGSSDSDNGNSGNSSDSDEDFTAAMVTDTGGVDDKSFNQLSWEALRVWGEDHRLVQGSDCFDYSQSEDDSDYLPNLSSLAKNDFNIIFGVGFFLEYAIEEVAVQ